MAATVLALRARKGRIVATRINAHRHLLRGVVDVNIDKVGSPPRKEERRLFSKHIYNDRGPARSVLPASSPPPLPREQRPPCGRAMLAREQASRAL